MNLEPLGDRVLIEPIDEEEKSAGGIIIPDTAKEKPLQGIVKAVGPGKPTEDGKSTPLSVKPGDRVLHEKYGGTEVKLEGNNYLLLRESDILAIIK
jgi:chaperonin GroES